MKDLGMGDFMIVCFGERGEKGFIFSRYCYFF